MTIRLIRINYITFIKQQSLPYEDQNDIILKMENTVEAVVLRY